MIECKFEGLEELIKKTKPEILAGRPLRRLLHKATLLINRKAKRGTPHDTDRLRASITTAIDAHPVPLWGKVGTSVYYARYVEFGTRPHFPPPDALEVWARRHGFKSSYVVGRTIARHGTKARLMFTNALKNSKEKINGFIGDCAKEIEAAWKA